MRMPGTASRLGEVVQSWREVAGIGSRRLPSPNGVASLILGDAALRPPAEVRRIATWERLHGYALPMALKAWLRLSDGLFGPEGPLIHPLSAIGPMIPFACVPDLIVQPESWFELGNPGTETVCIDLAYTWPGGDFPIFVSGDDQLGTAPRIIAPSFVAWLERVLAEAGHPFWLDPRFAPLGDPWTEHRRRAPAPPLPEHLRALATPARLLMRPGADDRSIAERLGISRGDVELLFRHLQHSIPVG